MVESKKPPQVTGTMRIQNGEVPHKKGIPGHYSVYYMDLSIVLGNHIYLHPSSLKLLRDLENPMIPFSTHGVG